MPPAQGPQPLERRASVPEEPVCRRVDEAVPGAVGQLVAAAGLDPDLPEGAGHERLDVRPPGVGLAELWVRALRFMPWEVTSQQPAQAFRGDSVPRHALIERLR